MTNKMLSYCLKCRNTESKNPKVVKTKIGRIMLLSKCRGLLSSLGIWKPLSRIPLLGPLLF